MLGTDFRAGSPNWLDLSSPDTDTAAAFYGAVFGWRFVSAGPEAGGYGFFQQDGRTVGALGPLMEEGAAPAWTAYFRSDDPRATTRGVVAGGGTVRVEPMDVMGEGQLAQYTDPQGARFAVWQPGRTKGLEKASEDNALLWLELHTSDPAAAFGFYGSLFGWRSEQMSVPGMSYQVLSIADGDQQEGTFGGLCPLRDADEPVRWVPYFAVSDTDAVVTRVRENGGSVDTPAADIPDVGRFAWFTDPHGALFAVLRPNPRQD